MAAARIQAQADHHRDSRGPRDQRHGRRSRITSFPATVPDDMTAYRALPLRRKLALIGVATATAAVIVSSIGSLLTSYVLVRRMVHADIVAQAAIVADNTTAALAFGDREAALETLRALHAKPSIDLACLYDRAGALFSRYAAGGVGAGCPEAAPRDADLTASGHLVLARPVTIESRRIGTLYIRANLEEVANRVRAQTYAAVVGFALTTLVAFVLAHRLQRTISSPISRLAQTARDISSRNDYSVRAEQTTDDEIGSLVVSFNEMIGQIERRDTQLSQTNQELSREIDERLRIERERAALLKREREANRVKDEFLAALSHELRTPLNAILGWTQILRTTTPDAEKTARALASVERNAETQARMIEDLLDISRIVTGKFHLKMAVVDLVRIVDAAIEVIRPAADAKSIHIDRAVSDGPCLASGDADRLQQVMWNLLSNAVKFTPGGGRIDVRIASDHEQWAVTIHDTGIGIGSDFLPHVFDRFRQADGSMTREHGGLGLGLAIVREIVELHGGTTRAYSEGRHRGATFEVRVPQLISAERIVQLDSAAEGAVRRHALDALSILVVDDDTDAREIAAATLAAAGARVATFASATDALAALESEPFDVWVTDIAMPVVDGYAFLRLARKREASRGRVTPAVALTAYASADDAAVAYEQGFQRHVAKPFDMAVLIDAVAAAARPASPQPSGSDAGR